MLAFLGVGLGLGFGVAIALVALRVVWISMVAGSSSSKSPLGVDFGVEVVL